MMYNFRNDEVIKPLDWKYWESGWGAWVAILKVHGLFNRISSVLQPACFYPLCSACAFLWMPAIVDLISHLFSTWVMLHHQDALPAPPPFFFWANPLLLFMVRRSLVNYDCFSLPLTYIRYINTYLNLLGNNYHRWFLSFNPPFA